MKRPAPYREDGKWLLDLRGFGFGRRIPLGPDSLTEMEATHLAYAKLGELRDATVLGSGSQLALRPIGAAPELFAQALAVWKRGKEYGTDAGKVYGDDVAKQVEKELGSLRLVEFAGAAGTERLRLYKELLLSRKLSARTVRNRFSVVLQVLKLCASNDRRWLDGLPAAPLMPKKPKPLFNWIDEPTFRAIREGIFTGLHTGRISKEDTGGESVPIYIARRKVYLSWLFYTGCHLADADKLEDLHVMLDSGIYIRHNSKSADHVPDEQFPMPEPLLSDLRVLLGMLGREAFYSGEAIGGGPWRSVNRVMQASAKRLGIAVGPGARVNTRILRRSFVRIVRLLGHTEAECSHLMGHSDDTMVREVYLRIPRAAGRERSRWGSAPLAGRPTDHVGRRVLQFPIQAKGGSAEQ